MAWKKAPDEKEELVVVAGMDVKILFLGALEIWPGHVRDEGVPGNTGRIRETLKGRVHNVAEHEVR